MGKRILSTALSTHVRGYDVPEVRVTIILATSSNMNQIE
jgi:hypothetical protein